jgi:hypothetical protein
MIIYISGPQVGPSGGAVPATFGADMLAKYGQSSIMVIPRWATRIYFDVGLPAENEKEHNSFYGPNCIGAGQSMHAMGRETSLNLAWIFLTPTTVQNDRQFAPNLAKIHMLILIGFGPF